VFALSGLGFAGSNLVLAGAMPAADYGLFALALALVQIGVPVGTAGADILVNRHRLSPSRSLLSRAVASALVVAAALCWLAHGFYGLDFRIVSLLMVATVFGPINWLGAAYFQSRQKFRESLWLSQNQNLVLVIAAGVVVATSAQEAWVPLLIVAIGYALSTLAGFAALSRSPDRHDGPTPSFWEGLAAIGASGAMFVMVQLDRLAIPSLLDVESLATFAVLAAVIGAPFRVLQLASTFVMVPKIRAATTPEHRRAVLLGESRSILAATILAGAVMWLLAPPVVSFFAGDRYALGPTLVLAAVVGGMAKVAGEIAAASVTAVGTKTHLVWLTAISWVSVGVGVLGAIIGARWHLTGVVFGVAAGWGFRAIAVALLLPGSLSSPPAAVQTGDA
jgi:O-antigen/teichoic acid export membrane protein